MLEYNNLLKYNNVLEYDDVQKYDVVLQIIFCVVGLEDAPPAAKLLTLRILYKALLTCIGHSSNNKVLVD